MNKDIDSWCVQVTRENVESVKKWGGEELHRYWFSLGSFYGINKEGYKAGHSTLFKDKHFSKVISTEEFLQKINVQQEFNIWN